MVRQAEWGEGMGIRVATWAEHRLTAWLLREEPRRGLPLCNFERLRAAIIPCDVILVEGRSRVGSVIKTITQSTWSHSALFIGCLNQMGEGHLRQAVAAWYDGDPEEPLLVEAELGVGARIVPLSQYRDYHLRICRPQGISQWDAIKVIEFCVSRVGMDYDVRQILDLGRFLLPYGIIPRRWRSSLFQHNAGDPTRHTCSSMLAQAFMTVNYPILPVVQRDIYGQLRLYRRNFRLFTPKDFDISPYFEIVKYPLVGHDDLTNYRNLPWDTEGLMCDGEQDCFRPKREPPARLPWRYLMIVWRRLLRRLGWRSRRPAPERALVVNRPVDRKRG